MLMRVTYRANCKHLHEEASRLHIDMHTYTFHTCSSCMYTNHLHTCHIHTCIHAHMPNAHMPHAHILLLRSQAEQQRSLFQARYGHVEHVAEYWLRQWGGLRTGGVTLEAFTKSV